MDSDEETLHGAFVESQLTKLSQCRYFYIPDPVSTSGPGRRAKYGPKHSFFVVNIVVSELKVLQKKSLRVVPEVGEHVVGI